MSEQAKEPTLYRVKEGHNLTWPSGWPLGDKGRIRGRAGYVVDISAPFETDWCDGQQHKLEPAEPGDKATPHEHPRAVRMLRDLAEQDAPKPGFMDPQGVDAKMAELAARRTPESASIPTPDDTSAPKEDAETESEE